MKKKVLITGATDGIGKALAQLLWKDYDLILCGRSEDKMNELIKEVGEGCIYYECFDMVDDAQRNAFCESVIAQFGAIDVLVNNAGANVRKAKVAEIDLNELRYMFELNCVSPLALIQAFYPGMSERKKGLFINILSTCCLFNSPTMGAYSASKDAMQAISKALLKEVKSENIGVCNLYPGGVDTNFRAIPNHNYLKPETMANMIKACMENEEGCVHEIVVRPFIEENIC